MSHELTEEQLAELAKPSNAISTLDPSLWEELLSTIMLGSQAVDFSEFKTIDPIELETAQWRHYNAMVDLVMGSLRDNEWNACRMALQRKVAKAEASHG